MILVLPRKFFNGMLSHMELSLELRAIHNERAQALSAPKWTREREALETLNPKDLNSIKVSALGLKPWKKGPFELPGVFIDAEWDCRQKFSRLEAALPDLEDKKILDIGCGNGWYMRELVKRGATQVWGFDPQPLNLLQWQFLQKIDPVQGAELYLLGLEHLSHFPKTFDLIFHMGVLYHHRDPMTQLLELREALLPGGELILETIGVPGENATALIPPDRYANMPNVWWLPTLSCLKTMMERAKFTDIDIISTQWNKTLEQRKTEWIDGPSLADYLDPKNSDLTVEGHPAPERFVIKARRKL